MAQEKALCVLATTDRGSERCFRVALAPGGASSLLAGAVRRSADGSPLVGFAYTRDAGGNPIAIEPCPPAVWQGESALGVFYYAYDALQRLSYEACSPAVWRGQFVDAARQYENYYEYRCLCQLVSGERGDLLLSLMSRS